MIAGGMRQFLRDAQSSSRLPFCAGCGNGTISGLTLRAINELGIDLKDMVFTGGIGCSGSNLSGFYKAGVMLSLHGRPIAFATGVRLANPKLTVVVTSGDGDIADIGGNHLIHAARRNIDIKVIVSNNMCYGMTGGQVCSTTPFGATTMTTRQGNIYRNFDLCRLVKAAGAAYAARYSVAQPFALKESIKKALASKGFCFIEALSICPVQYGRRNMMDKPTDMLKYLMENCVTQEQASEMSPSELEGKLITGEFTDGTN